MKKRDFLSLVDLEREDILFLFDKAKAMKEAPADYGHALEGKTLGLLFEKASTRTRISFEVGIYQLGGYGLFLSANDLQLRRGETIADTARVLSRFLDGIMARTYAHHDLVALAEASTIPVINGLTDFLHPCQALSDYFTIEEKRGSLEGLKMAYVGDGNNVAHSLINGAAKLGVQLTVVTPRQFMPDEEVLRRAQLDATAPIQWTESLEVGLDGADIVYTDVWVSMGQEEEMEERLQIFRPYQINRDTFALAKSDALFMHCLPAHRGEEVTDEICDGDRSIILDQAENRLHVQKALLVFLLGGATREEVVQ